MRSSLSDDDLICIGIDRQIGVMSNHDDLSFGFRSYEKRYKFVEDGLIRQI